MVVLLQVFKTSSLFILHYVLSLFPLASVIYVTYYMDFTQISMRVNDLYLHHNGVKLHNLYQ